jgi:hypothetical protein
MNRPPLPPTDVDLDRNRTSRRGVVSPLLRERDSRDVLLRSVARVEPRVREGSRARRPSFADDGGDERRQARLRAGQIPGKREERGRLLLALGRETFARRVHQVRLGGAKKPRRIDDVVEKRVRASRVLVRRAKRRLR